MCVACVGTAAAMVVLGTSAVVGSVFGIKPPRSNNAKFINLLGSLSFTAITSLALKVLLGISVLGNHGFSLEGITSMMLWITPMTIIYSVAINLLLNRFWSEKNSQVKSCSCCDHSSFRSLHINLV